MAHDSPLTLRPAAWDEHADRWLSLACAGSTTLADLRAQVEQGASLFHVLAGELVCGAFLLRVDHLAQGAEGVIVAAAARLDGVDLTHTCIPAIEGLFQGCRTLRYHTESAALARKMARHGYEPREFVCYKDL